MYKTPAVITLFMFLACVNNLSAHTDSNKLFQTVNENKAKLVQQGVDERYCINCGMDLVMFYKTNYIAEGKNGHKYQFCSIHCLEKKLKDGVLLKNIKVVDAKSLKLIDAKEAFYVVGSKVSGTMSRVSKYAFENLEDAKKFQSKYGGKLVDFMQALEIAKEDFKK